MKDRRYIVYLHINKINRKVYVGITHHTNPELRWKSGYKGNPHFDSSIKKYGWNNFEHVILFKGLPKDIACREEILLIKRFRRKGLCYNIANGGEGSVAMSESTKEKLRQYRGPKASQYGVKQDERRVKLMSEVMKNEWVINKNKRMANFSLKPYQFKAGVEHPLYGKPLPDNIRLAVKLSLSKPVFMLDKNTLEILNEFDSATDAERFLNKKSHHISCCCNNNRKSAYGYKWIYKEDYK